MKTGRIFNIQRCSTEDGPGLRTTLFMKGCPMQCAWCHNPEGINAGFRIMWIESRCKGCGKCIEICPNAAIAASSDGIITDHEKCDLCGQCVAACLYNAREISGRQITVEEAVDIVKRDRIFYQKSGGGVTVSGGEACLQWEFTRDFLEICKRLSIHTALDTCGFVKTSHLETVLAHTDLVLYDLKVSAEDLHRRFTGVDIDLVLENAHAISQSGKPMWIRIPVIPGRTDSPENIAAIADIIRGLKAVERVDLLPFHRLGEAKYKGLGMAYRMEAGLGPPSKKKMALLAEIVLETVTHPIKVTWESGE
jgi:pyruvate formate lyase activating enzyme